MNLPLAGFIQAATDHGFEALPILWCSAEPSSYVSDDAFDKISGEICDGAACALAVRRHIPRPARRHGHRGHEDGEGELLRRVRQVVGAKVPLVISLDLHANLTPAMVELSDAMTIFRTYPHLDMAESGARAAPLLRRIFDQGRPAKAYRQASFLTPLNAQHTGSTPSRELYDLLQEAAPDGVILREIAAGFPPADIYHSGPAVVAFGEDQAAADAAADNLMQAFEAAEADFQSDLLEPLDAVRQAMAMNPEAGPIALADVQDNPGAGATADTTGLLHALVEGQAKGAVIALLYDPEVAAQAREIGPGASFRASLGGKTGGPGNGSFDGEFKVEALSDGCFDFTGEMYGGARAEIGTTALLRVERPDCDVRVIVGSDRCQCLDQAIFRHIGVEPGEQRILGIKSTVHFRADFEDIAQDIWTVACPGAHPCRLVDLPYKNLRPGVRLEPLGPVFRPG